MSSLQLRCIRIFSLVVLLCSLIPALPVQAASTEPDSGTPVLVTDIRSGSTGSFPANLTPLGDTLFFRADDGVYGQELWKTSPPYTQAVRVTDLNPKGGSAWPEELTVIGSTLFFRANDGQSGKELWKIEPPYTQPVQVADIHAGPEGSGPTELSVMGAGLFFQADDGEHGKELWLSLPPYQSAVQVADIFFGSGSSLPTHLTPLGWTMFFSADDSAGKELWKSEPPYNASSTHRVAVINTESYGSNPDDLMAVGERLFFSADDGTGREVWLTEPPYASARRMNTIDHKKPSEPTGFTNISSTIFFTASVGFSGAELRRADPPYDSTHTYRVEDVNPGFADSKPENKTVINETLFFSANDGKLGTRLWMSQPPYNEARPVNDVEPDIAGENPNHLTAVGSTLYFNATDEHGEELWMSEPPYTKAEMMFDLRRGTGSSTPAELTVVGQTMFWVASDGKKGRELWKLSHDLQLPDTGFAPGRVTVLKEQPAALKSAAEGDLRLEIPTLGVNAAIAGVPQSTRGWDLTWLGAQVGYLEGTAFPTLAGNSVLTGHSTLSNGAAGPFALLPQLRWGDRVILHAWGQQYVYEVRSVQRVTPQDTSALDPVDQPWITLMTCQGYDAASDSYRWRLAVGAVLVQVAPDGTQPRP